jgi:hypothetical protein
MKGEPEMTGLEVVLRCAILVLALTLFAALADRFSFPDHQADAMITGE